MNEFIKIYIRWEDIKMCGLETRLGKYHHCAPPPIKLFLRSETESLVESGIAIGDPFYRRPQTFH